MRSYTSAKVVGLAIVTLAMMLGAGASPVHATIYTWDGSENELWATADNWTPVTPPGPPTEADQAVFDATGIARNTVEVGMAAAQQVVFANAAATGDYTLESGTLTLGDATGAVTGEIEQTGDATNEIAADILDAGQEVILDVQAGTLRLTGRLGSDTNTVTLDDTSAVATGAVLEVTGDPAAANNLAGSIDVAGALNLVGGDALGEARIRLLNGGTINVAEGAVGALPVSDPARWFDASDAGTLTMSNTAYGDDRVSQWDDKSGGDYHATQAVEGNQPEYLADAIGDLGVIHFDSTGNNGGDEIKWLGFTEDSSIQTVFWLGKGAGFLLADDNSYHFHRGGTVHTDPTDPIWHSNWAADAIKDGDTYLNGDEVDGTTTGLPDDYSLVSVVTTDGGTVTASQFNKDRTYHWGDQYIGEVLIYDSRLSDAERQQVEAYLQAKWTDFLEYSSPVTVTGGAAGTVNVETDAYFGVLTLLDASALTTAKDAAAPAGDYTVGFSGTSIPSFDFTPIGGGPTPIATTLNTTDADLETGDVTIGDSGTTMTKTGAGTATLGSVSSKDYAQSPAAADLVLDVQAGELAFTGPVGTDATITLASGTQVLPGATLTAAGAGSNADGGIDVQGTLTLMGDDALGDAAITLNTGSALNLLKGGGLVAHWALDEAPGDTVAVDSVGGHDAAILGDPPPTLGVPGYGDGGTAYEFSGDSDQYLEAAGYAGPAGTTPRTAAAWVKVEEGNTDYLTIFSWGLDNNSERYNIRTNDNAGNGIMSALRLEVEGGYIIGSTPLNDGEWHHVAVSWADDGTPNVEDAVLYVDGQVEAISGVNPNAINTSPAGTLYLARDLRNTNNNLVGGLDDARIWDVALGDVASYSSPVTVLAGNTGAVTVQGGALMGALTLQEGATLEVGGVTPAPLDWLDTLGFAGTTIEDTTGADGVSDATLDTDATFTGAALAIPDVQGTLTKLGAGRAEFTDVTSDAAGATLTLDVDAGELAFTGAVGTPTAPISLGSVGGGTAGDVADGATLEITGAGNDLTGEVTVAGTLKSQGDSLGDSTVHLDAGRLEMQSISLPSASDPTETGLAQNWDAYEEVQQGADGDANWDAYYNGAAKNDEDDSKTWIFDAGALSPADADDSVLWIRKAYEFPGAYAVMNGGDSYDHLRFDGDNPTNDDHAFEIVFKADGIGGNQTLFESGAGVTGVHIRINDSGQVQYIMTNGSTDAVITYDPADDGIDLTAGFHQLIVTYDKNEGGGDDDRLTIYFDGEQKVTAADWTGLDNWAGGSAAGLGNDAGGAQWGSGPFLGQMAILRYYYDTVLGTTEAEANYDALLIGGFEDLPNAVTVSGESEFQATNLVTLAPATGSALTLNDGATLTVEGGGGAYDALQAASTDFEGFHVVNYGIDYDQCDVTLDLQADLALGALDGVLGGTNPDFLNVIKKGPAALIFDDASGTGNAGSMSLTAEAGPAVVVAGAGGADPLGGGLLYMSQDTAEGTLSGIRLASSGADDATVTLPSSLYTYSLPAETLGGTLTLGPQAYFGEATGATIALAGGCLAIGEGDTLTVVAEDGYALELGAPGGSYNVYTWDADYDGDLSAEGELIFEEGLQVTVSSGDAFADNVNVTVPAEARLHFEVGQNEWPDIEVQGLGLLSADAGAAMDYSTIDTQADAIVAVPLTGDHPTWAELGDCDQLMAVMDLDGDYLGIGCNNGGGDISGDGPAWEGTYKGVVFSDDTDITPAGDFVGTITESEKDGTHENEGYEILLQRDVTFDFVNTGGDGAALIADTGDPVDVTGGSLWTLSGAMDDSGGTADTVTRIGTAPVARVPGGDPASPGSMSDDILAFADQSGIVPSGVTLGLRNGILTIDSDNKQTALAADATLDVGSGATLNLADNPDDGYYKISRGTAEMQDGSYLRLSEAAGLSNVTFFDGAGIIVAGGYDPSWTTDGWPAASSVNIILGDDYDDVAETEYEPDVWDEDILLGQDAYLATVREPYADAITLTDPTTGYSILPMTQDGSVTSVTLAAGSAAATLNIDEGVTVDMTNDGGTGYAALNIGFAPGSEPFLPATAADLTYDQVPDGTVAFRSGTYDLGDVNVMGSTLEIGYAENPATQVNLDLDMDDGPVTVLDGGALVVLGRYEDRPDSTQAYTYLFDGTMGTQQIIDNGGTVEHHMRHYESDRSDPDAIPLQTVLQAMVFRTGATTDPEAVTTWLVDEEWRGTADGATWDPTGDEQESDGYYYPNVTLQDGAVVDIDTDHIDRHDLVVDLSLEGDATIRDDSNFVLGTVASNDATARALTLGHADDGTDSDVGLYTDTDIQGSTNGTTGAVTINAPQATLWVGGATVDPSTIFNIMDGPAESGVVLIYRGGDGTNTVPADFGTWNLGDAKEMRLHVDEAAAGEDPITNQFAATVNITDNSDWGYDYLGTPEDPNDDLIVHGHLSSAQHDAGDVVGIAHFSDVQMAADTALRLETINGAEDFVVDLTMAGDATVVNLDGVQPGYPGLGDIDFGGGSLTIAGSAETVLWNDATLTNMAVDKTIIIDNTIGYALSPDATNINNNHASLGLWDIEGDADADGLPTDAVLVLRQGGSLRAMVGTYDDVPGDGGELEPPVLSQHGQEIRVEAGDRPYIAGGEAIGDGNTADGTWIYFPNVVLEPDAHLYTKDNTANEMLFEFTLEGDADWTTDQPDNMYVGDITGDAGGSTLTLNDEWDAGGQVYLMGTLTDTHLVMDQAGLAVNLMDTADPAYTAEAPHSDLPAFDVDLNGETITMQQDGQVVAVWTDPGTGTVEFVPTPDSGDSASVHLHHGENGNLSGDNSLANLTLEVGESGEVRGFAQPVSYFAQTDPEREYGAVNHIWADVNFTGETGTLSGESSPGGSGTTGYPIFHDVTLPDVTEPDTDFHLTMSEQGAIMTDLAIEGDVTVEVLDAGGNDFDVYILDTTDLGTDSTITVEGSGEELRLAGTLGTDIYMDSENPLNSLRMLDAGYGQYSSGGHVLPASEGIWDFELNGYTVDVYMTNDQVDLLADAGDGTIVATRNNGTGQPLELAYGRWHSDPVTGEDPDGGKHEIASGAGTTTGTIIQLSNGNNTNLPVEIDPDLGDLNVNRFQGTIQVLDPDGTGGTLFDGVGQLDADAAGAAEGGAAGWYDHLFIDDACKAQLNVRDDEVDLRVGEVSVAAGGAATLLNNSNDGLQADHIWVGDMASTGTATLSISDVEMVEGSPVSTGNVTQLVGQVGSGVTAEVLGEVILTGGFGFSGGQMTIEGGGRANVLKTMTGDNITVNLGGILAVADDGFTQGGLGVNDGGVVALAADVDYSDDAASGATKATGVVIAKEAYSGTLTLTENATAIASEWTPLAAIASPLAGTATQVNFYGTADSMMLTLDGDDILADLGGPTAVAIDHDLRVAGAQSYTGGTTLSSGTVHVLDDDALGTGAVSILVPDGGDPKEDSRLILHDDADAGTNFDAPISLTGTSFSKNVLELRAATVDSALTFGGGTILAETASEVTGALTDGSDMLFSAGDTLTLSHASGIQLTGARNWEVQDGTVVFSGDVSDDGSGPYQLAKQGPGTLRLDAGTSGVDLLIAGGVVNFGPTAEPGGLTVLGDDTNLPTTVQIGDTSAYGVEADHDYAEVALADALGAIAIGADTTTTIDLSGSGTQVSLGSAGDWTFSGSLVPSFDTYSLGGGGGTLRVAPDVLVDVDYEGDSALDPTHIEIGRPAGTADDMAHIGTVVLQGDTDDGGVSGDIDIYGYAALDGADDSSADALAPIASADSVEVQTGGALDLGEAQLAHYEGVGNLVVDFAGIDMLGGGVSRAGDTLEEADVEALWGEASPASPLGGPIVIGGGAGGTTTVQSGAIAADLVEKVGPDTVRLDIHDEPSDKYNFMLDATVTDGRLVAADETAFGSPLNLEGTGTDSVLVIGQNDAVIEIETGNPATVTPWVGFALEDEATLEVAAGQTFQAAGLDIGDPAGEAVGHVTFAGGGTLDLGDTAVTGYDPVNVPDGVGAGSTLTIADGGTVIARYEDLDDTDAVGRAFRVKGGGTLNFATATTHNESGTGCKAVGWMEAGSTLALGPDLTGETYHGDWLTIRRYPVLVSPEGVDPETEPAVWDYQPGLTFDVDPDLDPAAGWSTWDGPGGAADRTYEINVGENTELDITNLVTTSANAWTTASYADDTGQTHEPVAHVEKTGAGYFMMHRTAWDEASDEARKAFWIVSGGTLGVDPTDAADHDGLGLDAYTWYNAGKPATAAVASQHLEGIEVLDGATLWWNGTHGFLPAGDYGLEAPLPADGSEGDGFNPGEFILHSGATLRAGNAGLTLGFANTHLDADGNVAVETYLCYPTIVTASPGEITFVGDVNLRSGIDANVADDITVNVDDGRTQFTGDLPGALSVDVVDTLNVKAGGTATLTQAHDDLDAATVDTGGALEFDLGEGGDETYATSLELNGVMDVTSGTVRLTQKNTRTVPGGSVEPTEGLAAWWKLDEAPGATIANEEIDRDGTDLYDGIIGGDPELGVDGMDGTSYRFDGDDWVRVGDEGDGQTFEVLNSVDSVSMTLWFKREGHGSDDDSAHNVRNVLVANGADNDNDNWVFASNENDDEELRYYVDSTGGGNEHNNTGVTMTQDEWHHLVATFDQNAADGNELKIYLDTELVFATADPAGTLANSAEGTLLSFAAQRLDQDGDPFEGRDTFVGLLDDIRFYERALEDWEMGLWIGDPEDWTGVVTVASGAALDAQAGLDYGLLTLSGDLTVGDGAAVSASSVAGALTGTATEEAPARLTVRDLASLDVGSLEGALTQINLGGTLTAQAGTSTVGAILDDAGDGSGAYGTLDLGADAAMALDGASHLDGLTNAGALDVADGVALTVDSTLDNSGTLGIGTGAAVDASAAAVAQVSGTTLTGGTWNVAGTLSLPAGTDIQTVGADATVALTGGAIQQAGASVLTNLATVSGALTIEDGASLDADDTTAGNLVNDGTLTVGADSALTVGGTLTGTGTTRVVGGTLDVANPTNGAYTYDGDLALGNAGDLTLAANGNTVTLTGAVTGAPQVTPWLSDTDSRLNYDAVEDPAGDALWESYYGGAPLGDPDHAWTFAAGARTPDSVLDDTLTALTGAYAFVPGDAGAAMTHFQSLPGNATDEDHSFELVFKPSDLDGKELLLDIGGSVDGTSILLWEDNLVYQVQSGNDDTAANATYTLAAGVPDGFHHLVGTLDMDEDEAGTDRLKLYFDGVLVDEIATRTDLNDWAGTNDSGLGATDNAAEAADDFDGQIALLRFYRDQVLDSGDVQANYNALVAPTLTIANGTAVDAQAGVTGALAIDLADDAGLQLGADSTAYSLTGGTGTTLTLPAGVGLALTGGGSVETLTMDDTSALAAGGDFTTTNRVAQYDDTTTTLTGGTFTAGGTMDLAGGSATALTTIGADASLTLSGPGAAFTGVAEDTLATVNGALAVTGGRNWDVDETAVTTLSVPGTLTVGADSAFDATGVTLSEYDDGANTLTGGTWDVGGTLTMPTGTDIQTIGAGAGATLRGSGLVMAAGDPPTDPFANLATNQGALTVTEGANLAPALAFDNQGALTVGPDSTATFDAAYTESAAPSPTTVEGEMVVNAAGSSTLADIQSSAGTGVLTVGAEADLALGGGVSNLAGVDVGENATLKLGPTGGGAATYDVADGGAINLAGGATLQVTGGTANADRIVGPGVVTENPHTLYQPDQNWDAAEDPTTGDDVWPSYWNGSPLNDEGDTRWTMNSDQTPNDVTDAVFVNVTKSYSFNASRAETSHMNSWAGNTRDDWDWAMEFVLKPTSSGDMTLFETGGAGNGLVMQVDGTEGTLEFITDSGNTQQEVEMTLPDNWLNEWHQVTFYFGNGDAPNDDWLAIFLDGQLEAPSDQVVGDPGGSNDAGLGKVNGAVAEGGIEDAPFMGEIAIFRHFNSNNDFATSNDIDTVGEYVLEHYNYYTWVQPPFATLVVDAGSILNADGGFTGFGNFDIAGTLNVNADSDATVPIEGTDGAAELGVGPDATLDAAAGVTGFNQVTVNGTLLAGGSDPSTNTNLTIGGTGSAVLDGGADYTITGTLDNTGALSLSSNAALTVDDAGSVTQLSAGTLDGGTWTLADGAALNLPGAASIDTLASGAEVTLGGAGAAMEGLGDLADNQGALTLDGGATLTTTGDLANTGALTVGSGSTLTVAGAYTQSGGTPTALDGELVVNGTAANSSNADAIEGDGSLTLANDVVFDADAALNGIGVKIGGVLNVNADSQTGGAVSDNSGGDDDSTLVIADGVTLAAAGGFTGLDDVDLGAGSALSVGANSDADGLIQGDAAATMTVPEGVSLNARGGVQMPAVELAGTMTLDGSSTIDTITDVAGGGVYGDLTVTSTADLTTTGPVTVESLTDSGSLDIAAGTTVTVADADFSGEVTIGDGATLSITESLAQYLPDLDYALTGGTWTLEANATLELPGIPPAVAIVDLRSDADVTLAGAGYAFDALTTLREVGGTLTVTDGADFTTTTFYGASGDLDSTGTIEVGTEGAGASTLTVTGDFNNNGDLTVGANGTVTVDGTYTESSTTVVDGELEIFGTDVASSTDHAITSPAETGVLTLGDGVTLDATGGFTGLGGVNLGGTLNVLDDSDATGPIADTSAADTSVLTVDNGVTLAANGGFTGLDTVNLGGTLEANAASDADGAITDTSGDDTSALTVAATLDANGGFTGLDAVTMPGTLNVNAASDADGLIDGQTTGIMNVADAVTVDANGGLADLAEINLLGDTATVNVNAASTGIGLIQGSSGIVNVAAAVPMDTDRFNTLGALNLATGATLTVNQVNPADPALSTNNVTAALDLDMTGTGTADATLDLRTNNLIVDYEAGSSPYDDIEGWIGDAYNGGAWDQPGITSSDADADDYALGVADTADGDFTAPADLEGESFDGDSVLVKYTFYADANLDGSIGTKDVNALINGWNGAYDGDPRWTVGDFNYDGSIGTKDVNKLINSWNTHSGEHLPEPATLALLGLGAAAMLARRRRRD